MNSRTLLLISLVVLALGCTSNNSPSATAGAEITEFAFDTTSATDKDMVELTLKVENVGAKTIDGNSKAWIYNAPFGEGAWRLDSINGDKSKKDIIGDGETIQTKDFFPFDTETGTSGALITKDMFFTPPGTPIGMKENYEFTARLCYPYRTTSSSTLSEVSPTEYKAKADTTAAGTINSAGPLRVELKSDSVIRSGGRIPMPFIITNVGGGYATSRKADADCTDEVADTPTFLRNKAKLTVLADGESTDCKDTEISLDSSGKAVAWCNIASSGENPKQESHVTATLTYNYFATKSAKIEVKGVLGGVEPGAAGTGGGVVVATLVRDICEKAGQKMEKYERAIPVCVEKGSDTPEAFDYPGTTVSVLAQPPACYKSDTYKPEILSTCDRDNRAKDLKDALGSRYDKATIRTLNTHDLSAKDLNIGKLTLADIDSWFISSQYTKSMLKDTDYWWCKSKDSPCTDTQDYIKPLGIVDYLCTTGTDNIIINGKKKGEICGDSDNIQLISKKDTLKEKATLVTHKTLKSTNNEDKIIKNLVSINGMTPDSFLNQPIYGLKITSINGQKISDMTKNTVGISDINLEDFYLKYLITGDNIYYEYKTSANPLYEEKTGDDTGKTSIIDATLNTGVKHSSSKDTSPDTSLLDHIKCDSSTTYTKDVHAFCVTSVGKYNGVNPPFAKFSGTSSSDCNTKCKSFGSTYLGACNSADKKDKYECKGRNIIVYGLDVTATSKNQYGCSDDCLCYRTEKADMTSAETMLLCQK